MAGKKSKLMIPFYPVELLMKEHSTLRVADKAVVAMTEELIKQGKKISDKAWQIALHSGRRTITDSDIRLASEQLEK